MTRNILFLGVLILTLISCKESEKKNSPYIHKVGESIVQLKILNGKNYLVYDTPNRVNFEWTNTDPKTGIIYGAGIKILDNKDGISTAEINVPSNFLNKDTLNIKLHYEVKGQIVKTEFNVPIKSRK